MDSHYVVLVLGDLLEVKNRVPQRLWQRVPKPVSVLTGKLKIDPVCDLIAQVVQY
jgi:hypothetical protein